MRYQRYPTFDPTNVLARNDPTNGSSAGQTRPYPIMAGQESRPPIAELFLETRSPKVQASLELIDWAAKCNAPVVLQGEAGVGKKVFACALHARRWRHSKPFVIVACHGIAEEALARELFGSGGLAFSTFDRAGCVEAAAGGTLYLDAVADLPPGLQTGLLRLLHEQRFVRCGESRSRRANVRIVVASRQSLEAEVAAGRFDPDLFFRLNVIEIHVPPLRERMEDVLPLARHFLAFFARSLDREVPTLSAKAEAALLDYDWPGNVGELRNAVERVVTLWPERVIEPAAFPEHLHERHVTVPECGGDFTLEEIERRHVLALLARNDKLDEVARTLGIDVSTLWRKRKKYEES